jgi:hypothetical protein
MRFLPPIFSQMNSSQAPYSVFKDFLSFGFDFEEIIMIFDWLSAIIYSGELILPVLFNMRVATLCIMRAESHYFLELSA